MKFRIVVLFSVAIILFAACSKSHKAKIVESGNIVLNFNHKIVNKPIWYDTLIYVNEAGNPYLINEIQYFISEVALFDQNGDSVAINQWKDIHYVDTDIKTTWRWEVFDKIPARTYNMIKFTFGLNEEKNQSYRFVNPPENNMFWPEYLGGGYHYLKLNGKWLPEGEEREMPFDFHLGIGQIYEDDTTYSDTTYDIPAIKEFVHNYFTVELDQKQFTINRNESTKVEIVMNVERWFTGPNVFNFDVWKGYIMQNQQAMEIARENGHNVFTIGEIE
ncbi:MAG: hypothetical protein K9I94_14750 [Bacteroidales bacterium]|nr:hypothetical protein [Bacteroidales bacterium]